MMFFPACILAVAILFISPAPCRCEDEQVFGGNFFSKKKYLWFAALLEGIDRKDFICSGALISPRHVITADHCLRGRSIDSFWVRVGYYCPRSDNCGRTFRSRNVVEHRRDPSLGDVAILVLSSKAPSVFVPAIPDVGLPSHLSRVTRGGEMLLVGAGRDGTFDQVARRAETLKLQLQHTKSKKCANAISDEETRKRVVSKATVCSISNEGTPCKGDSGSAILFEGADSDGDVIVAIHNYGPGDCSGADDAVLFGHVSVSAVAEFVVLVVCVGDKKEKWCPSTSFPSPSPPSPPLDAATCMDVCYPFISAEVGAPSGSTSCPPSLTPDVVGSPAISAEACAPVCPLSCPPTPDVPVLNGDSLQATLLHDLTDHADDVWSVAFDATSSRLVSAEKDKIVHVWDPSNGGPPQMTFRLDGCCSQTVTFNPAGTMLAMDNGWHVAVLQILNTDSASEPRQLQGHTDWVTGVAWHPDGSMLASGADDDTVRLWDVSTGNVLHTFQGHSSDVRSISFDRQGQYIASASEDSTIRLWRVSTLSHVRTMQGHTSDLRSVAFSSDGTKLASGSLDETVRVWRTSDGAPLGVFAVGSDVRSVGWSPDGQLVVSGSDDGVVRIWDANKDGGEALLELKGHSSQVWSVAWSGNGKWIASGSFDDTVKVWEISSN